MKKIKIKTYLKNIAFSTQTVYNFIGKIDIEKKEIQYKEESTKMTLEFLKKPSITRENKEYSIKMNFDIEKPTKCIYFLKEYEKELNFKIKTNKIFINENTVFISYDLIKDKEDKESYEYYLEWRQI